jgi:hypothetical protein
MVDLCRFSFRTIRSGPATLVPLFRREIVERLRATGEQILDTDLALVSTLCYAHINGTYNFEGQIQRDNPAYNTLP